jgi:ParB family chromosome partitioning protein
VIETIKLNRLRLSPINVRTASDDQLRLDELTPDIAARGVLQNLLVTPGKPRGTYEIFDGGRRFRALMRLVEAGTIDAADYDVPVKIMKGDEATLSETSFAASYHQLKLTPAEECRAFQHFIGKGADIDDVAKRFGTTRRFVEGRLRLASLADPIFDALAAGEITLDLAKAYASTESHEKQLHVWSSYGSHGYATADTIRRVIANDTLKSNEPIAILVGEERYRSGGGRIDCDLFSEAGDRWVDPEIAHKLAAEIMETEAKRIGEETGFAWIRPIASSYARNHAEGLYRVMLPQPDLTEEQAARQDAIVARREELESLMEDENLSDEEYAAFEQETETLDAEFEAIENRAPVLPDELRPHVGVFLLLTPQGEMQLDGVYYSEQPIRRVEPQADEDGGEAGDGEPVEGAGDREGQDGARIVGGFQIGEERRSTEGSADGGAPGSKPISARLQDELVMQRRDILAACLIADPALALDYALFTMIDARSHGVGGYNHYTAKYGSTIRASGPQDPITGEMPATRARGYLAEVHDGLDATWTEFEAEVDRFEAFRALEDDSKAAWLAYIVAMSLEAKPGYAHARIPLHDRLAAILEVDVAAWWRPTAANYFDRVSKGSILGVLNEVGGPAVMARHATMKKGEIAASCEKIFAGEAIVEPEVKQAALAWVPPVMQFLEAPTDTEIASADGEDDLEAVEDGDTDDLGAVEHIDTDEATIAA